MMGATASRADVRAASVKSALYALFDAMNDVTNSTTMLASRSFIERLTNGGTPRRTVSTSSSRMLRRITCSNTSSASC